MQKLSSLATWGAAVLLMSSLSSCEDIFEKHFPKPTPTPPTVPTIPTFPPLGQDISFYALAGGTRLDAYSTANAATRTSSVAITGLGSGETLLAIDFRPATGQLYGVSSASRLYVINQNTGAARAIGAGAFTPAVAGNLVGFDFNPTVDRIRLVTSTGQNLRLNPETGTVAATDGMLNGAAGATITGAAYTNNVAGASTTVLFDLDPATDQLYRQDPPNDGTLVAVGNLNLNITGDGGFDIDARTGTALGLYAVNGNPTLFTVDLSTGAARPLAQYAANAGYTGIAIPTRPVAYAVTTENRSATDKSYSFIIFDPTTPSTPGVVKEMTGFVGRDEILIGADFRPSNGQLYVLTDAGRLYSVNAATGQPTFVTRAEVVVGSSLIGIDDFDFNPVDDQIRIINEDGLNVRMNPTTGAITPDTRLNPGTPEVTAIAHSNNLAGTTTTSVYAIGRDARFAEQGKLYLLNPANAGTLQTVGNAPSYFAEFDIAGTSNTGYALFGQVASQLYTINLATGTFNLTGTLNLPQGTRGEVRGLAIGLGF